MLAWLTLAVASVAAIGSVVGPFIAYRATLRNLQARSTEAAAERQQAAVDRAVDMALDQDPTTAEVGIGMLRYFARSGELTQEQTTAVYAALDSLVSAPHELLDAEGFDQDTSDQDALDQGSDNGVEEGGRDDE